jgi:ABC-2 type transport system permease protein
MNSSARQLRELVLTSFREFGRDRLAALFTFVMPLMFAVIFGLSGRAAAVSVPSLTLGIDDQANTPRSHALVRNLSAAPGLSTRVLGIAGGPNGFRYDDLAGTLVIRPDAFAASDNKSVDLVAPPPTTPFLVAAITAAGLQVDADRGFVVNASAPPTAANPFRTFLPGLLALAVLELGLLGTAAPLVSARQRGTMQFLAVTPVDPRLVLAAQLGLRLTVVVLQMVMMIAVGVLFFKVPLTADLIALGGVGALGGIMMIAIGYALAGVVPPKDSGLTIIMIVNFAMMFVGGVFFDPSTSPTWPAPLVMPIMYVADLGRHLGAGHTIMPAWLDLAIIAAMTVAAMIVSVKTFRFQGDLE